MRSLGIARAGRDLVCVHAAGNFCGLSSEAVTNCLCLTLKVSAGYSWSLWALCYAYALSYAFVALFACRRTPVARVAAGSSWVYSRRAVAGVDDC